MKKKILFIIIVILLILVILGAVVIGLLLNKNKSDSSKLGDKFYSYLNGLIGEKNNVSEKSEKDKQDNEKIDETKDENNQNKNDDELNNKFLQIDNVDDVYKQYVNNKQYEKTTKYWTSKPIDYCMCDINKDGQKELIIGSENKDGWKSSLIITYDKYINKVVEVADIYSYGELRYSKNDKQIVYAETKPFENANSYGFYEIKRNKLARVKTVGSDDFGSYFIHIEGQNLKHVSKEECDKQYKDLVYLRFSDSN